jgi:hypothetical protein
MELYYVYVTAAIIVGTFLIQVLAGKFDPFSPLWLFLVGYLQVYVVQAISYHDWAIRVRGPEIVTMANVRALWALVWFLAVFHCGLGRWIASVLPRPSAGWSTVTVGLLSPLMIAWGLVCAGVLIRSQDPAQQSAEEAVFRSFPFVMLVGANLLIVTGRTSNPPRPALTAMGLAIAAFYVLIWMFNGKRSHSLIGVLSATCAFYIARQRRPSWPVLIATAFSGALAVAVAIGWRMDKEHDRSVGGFVGFLGDFRPASILTNFDVEGADGDAERPISYETREYGGFLIMMTAVPSLSGHDYGASYMRVFSTFIPRFLWPSKPLYGREQWVGAWIAASELPRDSTFTGPAIGILGATQLNGGAWGTAIVLACLALIIRTAYDYFRMYADVPLVQVFWSITYFNPWFMVVGDDPLTWFYYNWGFTSMPMLVFLWFVNRSKGVAAGVARPAIVG